MYPSLVRAKRDSGANPAGSACSVRNVPSEANASATWVRSSDGCGLGPPRASASSAAESSIALTAATAISSSAYGDGSSPPLPCSSSITWPEWPGAPLPGAPSPRASRPSATQASSSGAPGAVIGADDLASAVGQGSQRPAQLGCAWAELASPLSKGRAPDALKVVERRDALDRQTLIAPKRNLG